MMPIMRNFETTNEKSQRNRSSEKKMHQEIFCLQSFIVSENPARLNFLQLQKTSH
jgi:hypothetical protein